MPVPIYMTLAISLVTGLIGLLVGNRLAIGRDKRKEFNDMAEHIAIVLLNARELPFPSDEWPDKMAIHFFREALPFWRRRGFDAALCRCNQARGDDNTTTEDKYGDISYKDTNLVAHCIDRLLKFRRKK